MIKVFKIEFYDFEINKVIEYWFCVLERNNEDESKEWIKDGWWF